MTMLDRFAARVDARPDAPMLTLSEGIALSRAQVLDRVRTIARRLSLHAQPGDVIATALTRAPAALIMELAISWAGLTSLPFDSRTPRPQLDDSMRRAKARILLTDDDARAAMTDLDGPRLPDPLAVNATRACIVHTSGSTGPPKLVPVTWQQIDAVVDAFTERLVILPDWRYVSHLPYQHIAERFLSLWVAPALGWNVRVTAPGSTQRAHALAKHRPQLHFDVPLRWQAEADHLTPTGWWADVQVAISASAPIAPTTIERLRERGIPIDQLYGMSETANIISCGLDGPAGSVGRPLPTSLTAVLFAENELHVRGPAVFDGYLDTPTPRVRIPAGLSADEWFPTGDRAHYDSQGNLWLDGRIGDTIITSGGIKIEPAPIEAEVRALPHVENCVLLGDGAARPTLIVSCPTGDAPGADIDAVLDRMLPPDAMPYLLVRRDRWTESRELTDTGKIRRAHLATMYQEAIV